jgi:hypothetical protein
VTTTLWRVPIFNEEVACMSERFERKIYDLSETE